MNLKSIFEPKTIAVVGVSLTNPFNPANVIYTKNHLHNSARTYCINPKGGMLHGETVYRSFPELPEKIDLAILCIKADLIPDTIKECISAGVSAALVISGGFSEIGRYDLRDKIVELSFKHNFPIMGPNCIGIYSPPHVDSFFLPHERLIEPKPGHVTLLSQSGGILLDHIIKLTQESVGLARCVSIGNKAVIDEVDVLRFLKKDKNTKVIGIYLEGFKANRGREFIEEVNTSKKPIIVIKAGRTPDGTRAANSHTAALAGDYEVFTQVLKESRAIEAYNEKEFCAYCEIFSAYPNKKIKNVCIITTSGGHGVVASDGCSSVGLQLVQPPEKDKDELKSLLAPRIQNIVSLYNPIDMTGSAKDEDFITATRYFLERDYVDCIMLLLLPYIPGLTSDIGARISQLKIEYGKPIIVYIPRVEKYGMFIEGFEMNGIPVAHSVDSTVHMANGLAGKQI